MTARQSFPLSHSIDGPDIATVKAFLDNPLRNKGGATAEAMLRRFFTGRTHPHVTTAHMNDL